MEILILEILVVKRKKRTAFAKSSSGKQIMSALIQELRKYESKGLIKRKSSHSFLKLVKDNTGNCIGCIIIDNKTDKIIPLKGDGVIIASGGMQGLFRNTTGSLNNNSITTAELFVSGVSIANTEFIQYHPTTVKFSRKNLLISEAARGEGGRLFTNYNNKKSYFMEEKYPELGNLMPRDIVSKEIWKIMNNNVMNNNTNINDNNIFSDKENSMKKKFCLFRFNSN